MKTKLIAVLFAAGTLLWGGDSFTVPSHVKFIKTGWCDPTPSFLAKNLKMIEKALPHRGVAITLENLKDDAGRTVLPSYTMFTRRKMQKAWFASQIRDLKSVKSKKLTDNFIKTGLLDAERKFDLYDDAFWEGVCHNFHLIASVAKEGGMKGIILDIEDYFRQQNWRYRPEKGRSFREDYAKARQRGREFISAVCKGYDNINILAFFWLELDPSMSQHTPELLEKKLMISHSGLLSGFINGIYDRLSPRAKIHDGLEDHCYKISDGITSFNRFRALRANRYKRLIDPVNHDKLRAQTLFAPAMYIDSYINPPGKYALSRKGMSQLELFRSNAALAAEFSDCYVWTFSEGRKWYEIPYKKWQEKSLKKSPQYPGPFWENALPGIYDAITYAQNPYVTALAWANKGKLAKNNVVVNGDFSSVRKTGKKDNAPDVITLKGVSGWSCWFPKNGKGAFLHSKKEGRKESACIKAVNLTRGCILQNIRLKKGKSYLIRASIKGGEKAVMSIQWRDAKNRWVAQLENLRSNFEEDLGNGWKRAVQFVFSPPEEASFFSIVISPNAASGSKSSILIDDVEALEI